MKTPIETALSALRLAADNLQTSLDLVHQAIDRLTTEQTTSPPAVVAERHQDCISRGVPEGHDTVLGYLARFHPEVLDLMNYSDPEATARDGFWLAHRHSVQTFVPAPEVLRRAGIM